MHVDACGSMRMHVDEGGCILMLVDGCGRIWMHVDVDECECMWMGVEGSGLM